MRKAYEIKAYAVDGAYKGTLPVSKRISDIRYEIQLNGGQGQTDIELNLPWNDSTYSVGDFLQVYCYDSNSPSGRIIFTGQVGKIVRLTNSGVEKINLSCLGLVALLSQVIFAPG